MANDARRKEKKRLKREQKRKAHRREMSVSPYARIAQHGQVEACYINTNWKENGLASIHLVRRNPAGGFAMAVFLIDIWCAGLKEAFGRIDLMHEDVKHSLDRARGNFELTRIDVETARKFVASGIRFARQNGFRLPAHLDRYTQLIGGVGDTASADLTRFGQDGKLHWLGSMEQLRALLIGSTIEAFLARPDVVFTLMSNRRGDLDEFADDFDEEDDEEFDDNSDEEEDRLVDEMIALHKSAARKIADKARQKLLERGEQPLPQFDAAVEFLFATETVRRKEQPLTSDENWSAMQTAARCILLELIPATENPQVPPELKDAAVQASAILREFDSEFADEMKAAKAAPGAQHGLSA